MAITLNLVVNKQNNRVLYAECDSSFVDILLSFMTLPLGTIVRLLDKKSGLEFLDNLYQSIDNLETKYFHTESCKSMLLQPRSNAEQQCEDLAINIDDLDPRRLFRCENWDCYSNKHPHYSSVVGVKCPCGQIMDKGMCWIKKDNDTDGVFVKCSARFIVSDDLHVQAVSSLPSVSFLQRLGVKDISVLEEIEIQIEKFQVLTLLKRSFHSKTPLTDVFLNNLASEDAVKSEKFNTNVKIKCEDEVPIKEHHNDNQLNAMKVKILLSKSSGKAILLRSENDFADLVFSFLTFPLGCTLSLLGTRYSSSTLGCIHNLYNSIGDLKDDKQEEILLAVSKDMLLYPKLAPYFGCSNQAMKVNEMQSTGTYLKSCQRCFKESVTVCLHNPSKVTVTELNPKMTKASSEYGGGFARSSSRFLIYSDMKVKPMPTISIIQQLKDLGVSSLDDLSDKEVTIGEAEALNLLLSCLTSTPFLNFK